MKKKPRIGQEKVSKIKPIKGQIRATKRITNMVAGFPIFGRPPARGNKIQKRRRSWPSNNPFFLLEGRQQELNIIKKPVSHGHPV